MPGTSVWCREVVFSRGSDVYEWNIEDEKEEWNICRDADRIGFLDR
jgi:hypothetical protein